MKKILVILALSFIMLNVKAQQDPLLTHIFFNKVFLNPAFAGLQEEICANVISRQQWVGFDGAPKTNAFTLNSPVRVFGMSSGIGLGLANDILGFEKNFAGNLNYSYIHSIGSGSLSGGIQLGVYNKAIDGTFTAPDGIDGDVIIPKSKEQSMAFDMGFGAAYLINNLYFGLSITHLLQPKFKFSTTEINYLRRHYYIMSGYKMALSNSPIELEPNVLIAYDGGSPQFTINMNMIYNKKFWGGVTYRTLDAMDLNVGIELFNGMKIGCAYGLNFSKLISTNSGSYEVMLGYCFNFGSGKEPQKYKSVRFL
ncbi:MAG: type IX secretion system membrane protein PorP/SprF [Bacteroidales bacterium]